MQLGEARGRGEESKSTTPTNAPNSQNPAYGLQAQVCPCGADVEDQITEGILSRIGFVSYKALPYAIGATGPKLGRKEKRKKPLMHDPSMPNLLQTLIYQETRGERGSSSKNRALLRERLAAT